MTETLTPRERVLMALEHQEPDRLPLDTWMSRGAIEKLCRRLGLPLESDPYGMWHAGILERLRVDFRRPYTPYIGPPLKVHPDGSWDTPNGVRRKGLGYGIALNHPLGDAREVEQVLAYPLPPVEWYDFSGLAGYCQRNAGYAFTGGSKFPLFHDVCDLMGMERAMTNLFDAPDLVHTLLDRLLAYYLALTQRWFDVAPGAIDILIITDDYGASQNLLVGPRQWREFLQPRLQKIIDYGHARGCKVMLHSDGAIRKLIPDLIAMGLDVLNPIEPEAAGMEPSGIKRDFGDRLVLHGAVSNLNLAFGDPASIRAEVERLVSEVAPGGGFVLCPSNHLMEDMPVENILALYDIAYELGAYQREYHL